MTTEQKAKAYDEALERARKIHSEIVNNELLGFPGQIEDIFPQLRESEDERIRKAIIHYILYETKGTISEATEHTWVKWLEKQKINTEGDFGRGYDCGYEACLNSHGAEWLEKQKERGPLTKEEEYTLQRIIEYLEDETCPPEWISLLHDIYCLPYEKQKEQKPTWSEEDEKIMESLISLIETIGEYYISLETIDRYVAWLKSLRPSWKPSELHLSALLAVFNDPNNIDSQTCQLALTDLYEQLKKL